MRQYASHGVLVVGHGSRRSEANQDVREAARKISERGGFPLVEAAFLEIEHPNISEGFTSLIRRGARSITVHPYFLSPGRHTRGDIPREVAVAAACHGGIKYEISEPLAAHDLVIEASVERIRATGDFPTNMQFMPGAKAGMVYLVGAGPGDPGLLTVRASSLLQTCDVVIYDSLANPELLEYVSKTAHRIDVGKTRGRPQIEQTEINQLLVEHALRGQSVVRLKGGDPFLFGRGGEEAGALREARIRFEVVPGVSAALAVPAYAGIPLTHRGFSSSVTVVTGARAGDGEAPCEIIGSVAAGADTIVILMGVSHLAEIAEELIGRGRSPDTPAAVIRWGTYDGQETIVGSLSTIADDARKGGMRAPAVIVVGEVVRLRERLQWFEPNAAFSRSGELEFALATQ